jgi:hypothetical protein
LALLLAAALALRLNGLNWDGGHWLHPDERQIYFLALDLAWPASLGEALSPDSPLNPGFFAYGSLPIYLLRTAAGLAGLAWPAPSDPDNLHLVGRVMSALFDVGTVYLTYRLGLSYWRLDDAHREAEEARTAGAAAGPYLKAGHRRTGMALVAAGFVATAIIHVQSAHFYTADALLVFFVVLALNFAFSLARGAGWPAMAGLGISVGLALATKASAAPLLFLPFAAHLLRPVAGRNPVGTQGRPRRPLRPVILPLLLAAVVFSFAQPYALVDWPTFLGDILSEAQIASGRLDVPYTRQYAGTLPYLYPAWQTALWGLGLPLGLAGWAGFGALAARWLRWGRGADALLLAWAGPYFALTGLLYAKPLRYMLPLVPVLCLLAVDLVRRLALRSAVENRPGRLHLAGAASWTGLGIAGLWSVAYASLFVGIYGEQHSWIEASAWIYREVAVGSVLAVEDWDTPLPLPLEVDGGPQRIEAYDIRVLMLYEEPDAVLAGGFDKWDDLVGRLSESDYLLVASRRAYGTFAWLPERYPTAGRYYHLLFSGELGFEQVGEFIRGPAWLNPRVPPLPAAAPRSLIPDESFVVYDHPRTLVFRNTGRHSAEEILEKLTAP